MRVRHLDIVLGIVAVIVFVLALRVAPSVLCGVFQRSAWFIYLGWASFAAFALASVLCLVCRRRAVAKGLAFWLGFLVTCVCGVVLLAEGSPDKKGLGIGEHRTAPAYSTVQRVGRDVPPGKAIYWLGPQFDEARIDLVSYPDIWNIGGYEPEREQRKGVEIQYVQAPDHLFKWAVYVLTYRAEASALPGDQGSDVILHMSAGQDVRLRFGGSLHPSRELVARIRASLRPIPKHVGCIERP